MQFNFYALYTDKIQILDYIFRETGFTIVDHYSPMGKELKEYNATQEIVDNFDLHNGKSCAVSLALWNSNYGEKNIIRKIDLNPKYCKGHTFRFAATGWSLQQLYFGGLSGEMLYYSTIQGFNEKGAIEKDYLYPEASRTAHLLDWVQIKIDQRKLKYFIDKKLTTRKLNSYLVLSDADSELQSGRINLDRKLY